MSNGSLIKSMDNAMPWKEYKSDKHLSRRRSGSDIRYGNENSWVKRRQIRLLEPWETRQYLRPNSCENRGVMTGKSICELWDDILESFQLLNRLLFRLQRATVLTLNKCCAFVFFCVTATSTTRTNFRRTTRRAPEMWNPPLGGEFPPISKVVNFHLKKNDCYRQSISSHEKGERRQ